jgi:hypothetical protein
MSEPRIRLWPERGVVTPIPTAPEEKTRSRSLVEV